MIGTPGRKLPTPLEGECEEASMASVNFYIPCTRPAKRAVYHLNDDATYRMCNGCADHNIRNRGGEELIEEKLHESNT